MRTKRFLSLMLVLTLLVSLIVPVQAAGGSFTLSVTKDGNPVTSVQQNDEIVVTIKSPEIPHATMEGGIGIWITFDNNKFQMTGTPTSDIPGCDVRHDVTDAASANLSGSVKANSSNVTAGMSEGQLVVSATFIAKTAGSAAFGVNVAEISDGSGVDHNTEYPAPSDITVSIAKAPITSVSATVAQPVKGYPLDTSVSVPSAAGYTADVMWKADGVTVTGDAQADTVYTALITLKANEGETFATTLNNIQTSSGYTIQMLNSTELLLTKEFDRTNLKEATDIAIDNTTLTVAVPTAEPNTEQKAVLPLTAKVIYDDGTDATVDVSWSIVTNPKPEGVDIEEDGKLTVTNKAADGTVEVKAAYNGMIKTATVTITKETAKETKIVLTAPSSTTIDVPTGSGVKNYSDRCTAKVYDQYGNPITSAGVTYESDPATMPTGVTFAPTTGEFFVDNTAQNGTVKVIAKYGTVTSNPVAFTIKREAGTVNSVTLSGSDPILTVPEANGPKNPKSKSVTNTYTATVKDQFGVTMPGESVRWSVSGNAGVTINSSTGELKISSDATADSVTITATCKDKSDSKTVSVTRTIPAAKWVKITGQNDSSPITQFVIPAATGAISETSHDYKATVYDQYGKDYNENVDWSFYPNTVTGVTKEVSATNTNVVTIKVGSNAIAGDFDIIATSCSSSAVNGKIKITLTNKTPASLTVTQADTTYGTALANPVYNKDNMIDSTLKVTYVGRGSTSYAENTTKPTDAGTYTVNVTYETATQILSGSADFEIQAKSISGMTVTLNKTTTVYDGNNQTVSVTVKDGGSTLTKDTDYTVTGTTSGTNVNSHTVRVTGKGNYTDSVDRIWKITEKDVTLTGGIKATDRSYVKDNTTVDLTKETPTFTGLVGSETLDVDIPATGTISDANAGNGKTVTYSGVILKNGTTGMASNYKLVSPLPTVTVNITKETAPTLADINVSQKYNVTTEQSKDIGTAGMPADAGTLTYTEGNPAQTTGSVTIDSASLDATTGKVTYKLSNGAVGDTVTLPVTIKSTNYADATVNVVITLIKGSSGGYYYAPTTAVVPDMPMLYRGCTGDAVKTLQDKLNALGYNSGSVDGIFGAKTYAAVTAFQKANSLGVDGIVGKLTWGRLYGVSPAMPVETTTVVGRPTVSYGSRGDAVRKLQELLNALGYDCGSVDGIFGSKTKAAVLAFQKANGLGVDGIVGPLTWAKLG